MTLGHNNPPHVLSLEEAKYYAERAAALVIDSVEAQATALAMMNEGSTAGRVAETARVAEKEPYLKQGREVDECWRPVATTYADAIKLVKAKATAWTKREADRLAQEAEARRIEAERETEAAIQALQAYQGGFEAQLAVTLADEATEAAKAAETALAQASTIRADGERARSMKWTYTARVKDPAALVVALAAHPSVQEAAIKVAQSQARMMKGAFSLAGCELVKDQGF